jgi:hypothetical protein
MICNLVEGDAEVYPFDETGIQFDIAPYEIKTFKVWF